MDGQAVGLADGSTEVVATSGDSNSYTPLAIKRGSQSAGLKFPRRMTRAGADVFDSIEWERRTASITGEDGKAVFTQENCEIPKPWSQLATNVVVSKYFRGPLDSPRRETSVRQVIGRVAGTLHQWGREGNYFASDEDAQAFHDELAFLLLHQYGSFNSPVWFNIGVQGARQQASACFINSVHDNMESIMELASTEARLFKGGSGAGTNLWRVRSSKEQLSGGGIASGPVSFMRGWDSFAGAIKSGGTCLAPYQMVYTEAGPVAVEELARREEFIALSYDPPAGRMKAKRAQAWLAGRKRVVRVQTDKGAFDLSFDHPVKLSSGEFVRAGELKPGHSLFACSVDMQHGHLRLHLRDGKKGKEFLHRLIARDVMGADLTGRVVHHRDGDRLNNATGNLEVMFQFEHAGLHGRELAERGEHIFQTGDFSHVGAANGMHASSEFWHTERADAYRDTQRQVLVESGRASEMQREAARQKSLNTAFRILNGGWPIDTFEQYVQGRKLLVGRIPSISVLRQNLDEEFGSYDEFVREVARANHRVVSVQDVGEMDVYDVEVECPTPDDKSPHTGHNFVIWNGTEPIGSGVIVSNTRRAAKMVILNADHPDIRDFIVCKADEEKKAWALIDAGYPGGFNIPGGAYDSVAFQNANHSVRVTDEFMRAAENGMPWSTRAVTSGEPVETYNAKDMLMQIAESTHICGDPGLQYDTTINDWHTCAGTDRIYASNPCSEFLFLDDTACNLASLNLMRFRDSLGAFETDTFIHACETFITAQEIIVSRASYPTEKIARNSEDYRPLGLGYANLGALLMAQGTAYDSDEGRSLAGTITAVMTGSAYAQSARIASNIGPFNGYSQNREPMLRVIRKHRDAVQNIRRGLVPPDLLDAAQRVWDQALVLGEKHGYRNAQASVLAPTGTIAFMMDCDTTGIEPDIALVKYKKLVGGGLLKIVNQTVPEALRRLGYSGEETRSIVDFIDKNDTIEGAPALRDDDLSVFDCAFKAMNGTRSIHYMGHIKMMAAAQPFLSGAISKCIVGESLIFTAQGIRQIGDFYAGEKPGEFRACEETLASIGGNQRADLFYYGGVQPTIKLALADGRSIEGTWNHRVKVANAQGYDWKRLDEIGKDDYVAVRLGANFWAQQDAALGFEPGPSYGSQKAMRVPEKMTPKLARFVGQYIAEGSISRSNWTVRLTNNNPQVLEGALETVREVFGLEGQIATDARNGVTSLVVASKYVVEFLEHIGAGGRSDTKRIPWSILQSTEACVREFVGGLWLDGYVRGKDGMVAICLNSPELLKQLQVVLNNFGLRAHIIRKHNARYDKHFHELGMHGADARKFAELFTLDDPWKTERLQVLAATAKKISAVHSDVVPCFRDKIEAAIRQAKETSQWRNALDPRTKHLSWHTARAAYEKFDIPELAEIITGDIHFVRVAEISEDVQPVYDFQVPGNHAFLGNSIVNHNTVNLPQDCLVEDIYNAYLESWKLGVKAVAIYRDGSKRTQPLSTSQDKQPGEKVAEAPKPYRRKLPDERASITHKFSIAGQEGYFMVGLFEDGSPGEIFIKMNKEGSTISGLMDSFAISISMALQYGVPLRVLVNKFTNTRFEPAGYTANREIPIAKSLMDYIFRWFDMKFHPNGDNGSVHNGSVHKAEPNLLESSDKAPSSDARAAQAIPASAASTSRGSGGSNGAHAGDLTQGLIQAQTDAPPCSDCGSLMIRAGACYKCPDCGTTSGCG